MSLLLYFLVTILGSLVGSGMIIGFVLIQDHIAQKRYNKRHQ